MSDRGIDGGIEDYRRNIDDIDDKLVDLLNERARNVLAIGAIKHATGRSVFDLTREGEVLGRIKSVNEGPLSNRDLSSLFIHVMDIGRHMQHNQDWSVGKDAQTPQESHDEVATR